jgi:hypothetical protein
LPSTKATSASLGKPLSVNKIGSPWQRIAGVEVCLYDIEAVIERCHFVNEAVVVRKKRGLAAYFTVLPQFRSRSDRWRQAVRDIIDRELPPEKHPTCLKVVPELPRLRSGKPDRVKLSVEASRRVIRRKDDLRPDEMVDPVNDWHFEGLVEQITDNGDAVIAHRTMGGRAPAPATRRIVARLPPPGRRPRRLRPGQFVRADGIFVKEGRLLIQKVVVVEPRRKIPLGNVEEVLERL